MDIDGFTTTSGRRSAKDQDRDSHDLDQLTALQEFMGLPGDTDPQGYADVPRCRSEDLVCNFAGHQLRALGRSQGLLVLIGRVSRDSEGHLAFPKGEAVKTTSGPERLRFEVAFAVIMAVAISTVAHCFTMSKVVDCNSSGTCVITLEDFIVTIVSKRAQQTGPKGALTEKKPLLKLQPCGKLLSSLT
ncbi:hypothetical protein VOLCADRAFT_99543 [Volvox carteri f. nagariensis]|uniref:Uncharacterized protein n=1 Tax=Volvox carteri f. nagariensis TaxID=3068 RepID=D8UI08_VOLCA|nr:uncharacterized protein VOLCADRAFT_99543 [Volvox carteri f. nagariensis]EFJ40671.1 hypothetical protein VOLCADRAFT_99543 [Volvox carteri f. nagariensis]|eukprot:XP_002958297.1 hypothetical protein VOLCADRAFT_99543 [Volvox carteri f. nagariensis]